MRAIPRGRGGRGQWWSAAVDRSADGGGPSARLSCPGCGAVVTLAEHRIAADGVVTPAVRCPHPGCRFEDMVLLDGWATPAARERTWKCERGHVFGTPFVARVEACPVPTDGDPCGLPVTPAIVPIESCWLQPKGAA